MKSIKSPLLSTYNNLLHAFSTKEGGYSQPPYLGNNLAYHVDDDKNTVQKNHTFFSKELGYPEQRLVRMDQIHGDSIAIINKDSDISQIPICDALITNMKETPLMVMVADCIPVLIYDPLKEAIAAVHAGRAGVFSDIVPKTVKKLQTAFNSQPKDLIIVLGPSIHACCYEVGPDIKDESIRLGFAYAIKEKNKRFYLDLHSIVINQLRSLEIRQEQIDISPYCTSCDNALFYSYRAEKNKCGRFCGLIMLK